jgi:hypothetical protein
MDTYPQNLQIFCISCSWDYPETVTRPCLRLSKRLSELTTIKIIPISVFSRCRPVKRKAACSASTGEFAESKPGETRQEIVADLGKSLDLNRRFGWKHGREDLFMKSKLRLQSHSVATGENVIEVWHEGGIPGHDRRWRGAYRPHRDQTQMAAKPTPEDGSGVHVLEIRITAEN